MSDRGPQLYLRLDARMDALERKLKQAENRADQAARRIEDRFSRLNPGSRVATNFLTGLVTGFLGRDLTGSLVRGLADANREIASFAKTAKLAGLSVERLQELRFAGQRGGLSGADFDAGLKSMAEQLNRARREETEFGRLLEANGQKIKDRAGNVIGINEALARTADLMRNAATEFDKIAIAKVAGLTADWVPMLEKGAAAMQATAAEAESAGAVIDRETIRKAEEFDRAWTDAVNKWALTFKSVAPGIIGIIDEIIDKAAGLAGAFSSYAENLSALREVEVKGVGGASLAALEQIEKVFRSHGEVLPDDIAARLEELRELNRETERARALSRTQPMTITVGGGPATVIPTKPKRGVSDAEKRQREVERYIEALQRQQRILQAEFDTIGKSNAERAKAIELARIGTVADQAQLQRLERAVEANEALREKIEAAKLAQEGLNDAADYFGNVAVDAIMDLVANGAKAEDVIKRLASSLAQAALQAALLGQGPLAGLFGLSGTGGQAGGLFGAMKKLLGFSSGGYTGSGGKYEPAGVVHKGEYVFDKAAVARLGVGNLEALRRGAARGFADGGYVDMPRIPAPVQARGGDMPSVVVNNNASSAQASAQVVDGPDGKAIAVMVEDVVLGSIMNNGRIAQSLQGFYGLGRMRGR